MKPKICLVCDVKGWAFDNIAQYLKRIFYDKYEITISYYDADKEADNFYELIESNKDCDLIHFFWRKSILQIESVAFKSKVEKSGKDYSSYVESLKNKLSTGVYDFLYLDETDTYQSIFNCYTKNYYVTSKKLFSKYIKIKEYKAPLMVVHDVLNKEKFKPNHLERFESVNITNRAIVVGWCGNSKRKEKGIDLKGLETIIKPVIKELKEEGYNIVENYSDRNDKWKPLEEMPLYYGELDLYLCASIHEGTPLPVLEAMCSGVPVISTDVGVVPEVFGTAQKEFIIGSRDLGNNDENIKSILKEKIIQVYNNRNILKDLSQENLKSIDTYDGGKIKQEYEKYFEECLK